MINSNSMSKTLLSRLLPYYNVGSTLILSTFFFFHYYLYEVRVRKKTDCEQIILQHACVTKLDILLV